MRCFQAERFSRFLPSSYFGHVNLARAEPSRLMLNCKYGSPVEIILFRVQYLFSAYVPCQILRLYCKVAEWDIMQLVCVAGYFLNFSFNTTDGNMHHCDGNMHHMDDSVLHSDGIVHYSEGSIHRSVRTLNKYFSTSFVTMMVTCTTVMDA